MNKNAKILLIAYPYAAGGRFLLRCTELDDRVGTNVIADAQADHYCNIMQGRKECHFYAEDPMWDIASDLPYKDFYAFQIHPYGIDGYTLLDSYRDITLVAITCCTDTSARWLQQRRNYLEEPEIPKYELDQNGKLDIKFSWFDRMVQRIKPNKTLQLEIEDYWTPSKAPALIESVWTTLGLEPRGWEKFYHAWYTNAIEPVIKNCATQ